MNDIVYFFLFLNVGSKAFLTSRFALLLIETHLAQVNESIKYFNLNYKLYSLLCSRLNTLVARRFLTSRFALLLIETHLAQVNGNL